MSPLRTFAARAARPAVLVTTLGALGLGGLSACSIAGTGVQPGLAASVAGEAITSARVDEAATAFCEALSDGAFGDVGAVARSELRQGVAGNLLRQAAAERYAAEQGVTIGPYYAKVRSQTLESLPEGISEEAAEALVDVQSAPTYVNEVALAVGEKDLATGDDGEQVAPDAAQQRGTELFAAWLAEQDVEIDPSLGVALADDSSWVPADTEVTASSSSTAILAGLDPVGADGAPDPKYSAYVSSLPASQRCGT